MGHIVHRDNGYLLGLSLFPYITHVLGYLLILNARGLLEYSEYYSYYGMRDQAMGHAMLAFIGGIIGVALVILSVLIMVPVLAFSRIKEHLADLVAVEKFRDDSVIRALEKIEGCMVHTDFRLSKPSLKTMLYILPGFAEDIGISKLLKSVYSTHPPISARAYVCRCRLAELSNR